MLGPTRFFPAHAPRAIFVCALAFLSATAGAAQPPDEARVVLADSVAAVDPASGAPRLPAARARVARARLSAAEAAEPIEFEIALRMRDFAGLRARLDQGEQIPPGEMAEKYFPREESHAAVKDWLAAQGLAVTHEFPNRLALYARGTVADVAAALRVKFARVADDSGEFTSAVDAPSVPASLAVHLVGINGLQPHVRHRHRVRERPASLTTNSPPYTPAQIAKAYNADTLGLNGSGQTIAIVLDEVPVDSDLTAFWSLTGVGQTLANVQKVAVNGASQIASFDPEANLDVEWSGAMAPAAKIRFYYISFGTLTNYNLAFQQILADLPSQPGLRQLSLSIGLPESLTTNSSVQSTAQVFASLASQGVSIFVSTGDGGSNPNLTTGAYSPAAAAQISHPASDPSATAVGGTTLRLDLTTGAVSSETVWAGSGGGVSSLFDRPVWQTGAGVPSGTKRCVPDVAVAGDSATGSLTIYQGAQLTIGGTSWGAPVWAGFCALINQARTQAGRAPIGFLNNRVYPLISTANFRDITSGNNGAYSATAGYDLCTGVGVPNLAVLLQTLAGAPVIAASPVDAQLEAGFGASFSIDASGSPTPTLQWQRLAAGATAWTNLSDNAVYTGATAAKLSVKSTAYAMSGDQFRCVVTSGPFTQTSAPAAMLVSLPHATSIYAGAPGSRGFINGSASAARFDAIVGLAFDAAGNLFVADIGNAAIRKIAPDGSVTTFVSGTVFGSLENIAFDAAGNLYAADSRNQVIRKITPGGVATIMAGIGSAVGLADGPAASATFNTPRGVAVDRNGVVFVADSGNHTIRRIAIDGTVTTYAGVGGIPGSTDGPAASARFYTPWSLAFDPSGNLLVANFGQATIRKIAPDGTVSTLAGRAGSIGSQNGTGANARFQAIRGLAVNGAGGLAVVDSIDRTLRLVTAQGVVSSAAGLANTAGTTDGIGTAARFASLTAVAFDAAGNCYVADNFAVRKCVPMVAAAPAIATAPRAQTIAQGEAVTFSVAGTTYPAPTYQWRKDGVDLPGATSSTLTLPNVLFAGAGSYTVVVTNPLGAVTSAPALLTVQPVARIANLSILASLDEPDTLLTVGAVVGGAGTTGSKPLLVRAAGPALGAFGVPGVMPDPKLALLSGQTTVAANDNWGGSAPLNAVFAAVGAFGYPAASSRDAALYNADTAAGGYTVQIGGVGGATGLVLAELYDASPSAAFTVATPRLVNISALKQIKSGEILTVGFVVSGATTKQVLVRAVGPTLALPPFNIGFALADPKLELFSGQAVVKANDNWGGDTAIASAGAAVGAFPLGGATTKDAALLASLAPGDYTVQLTGVNNAAGLALIEVYEVP